MSGIDIKSEIIFDNLCQASAFASIPVSMQNFMGIAIHTVVVLKCLLNIVLGENAHPTAYHSTKNIELHYILPFFKITFHYVKDNHGINGC